MLSTKTRMEVRRRRYMMITEEKLWTEKDEYGRETLDGKIEL